MAHLGRNKEKSNFNRESNQYFSNFYRKRTKQHASGETNRIQALVEKYAFDISESLKGGNLTNFLDELNVNYNNWYYNGGGYSSSNFTINSCKEIYLDDKEGEEVIDYSKVPNPSLIKSCTYRLKTILGNTVYLKKEKHCYHHFIE